MHAPLELADVTIFFCLNGGSMRIPHCTSHASVVSHQPLAVLKAFYAKADEVKEVVKLDSISALALC